MTTRVRIRIGFINRDNRHIFSYNKAQVASQSELQVQHLCGARTGEFYHSDEMGPISKGLANPKTLVGA